MEPRPRGVVAVRLAARRPVRRRRVGAHPNDARRVSRSFLPARTGGPPLPPAAPRRRALAVALGLSALLHAALLVTATGRRAAFDGEPIPIPIAWLEGVAAGSAEGPGAPGTRTAAPPLEDPAPETEPELPMPAAAPAPAPRPRAAPASRQQPATRAATRAPETGTRTETETKTETKTGTETKTETKTGTETATETETEAETGTGTWAAGAETGGPGVASGPGGGRLVAGVLPRARHRPAPVYPREARRRGHTGTSAIRLRIAADGRVLEAQVHRTAGDAHLDAAALSAVRRWRFEPSPPGVDWREQWFLVPIEFRLQ